MEKPKRDLHVIMPKNIGRQSPLDLDSNAGLLKSDSRTMLNVQNTVHESVESNLSKVEASPQLKLSSINRVLFKDLSAESITQLAQFHGYVLEQFMDLEQS